MALVSQMFASKADADAYTQATPSGETRFAFWDDGTHHGFNVGELASGFGGVLTVIESTQFKEVSVAGFGWDGEDLQLKDADGAVLATVTGIRTALNLDNKVDKEAGKGLSEHDFTTALKSALEAVPSTYQPQEAGKGLSANDYDADAKGKVDTLATTYQPLEAGKGLSSEDFSTAHKTKLDAVEDPLAQGYHDTLAGLQAFAPTPRDKAFGYVKNGAGNYDLYVYDLATTAWVNKGEVSGSVTIQEIKQLVSGDTDVEFLTPTEAQAARDVPQNFVAKEVGKGLSSNNFTGDHRTKVDKLPTAAFNAALGLLRLGADGKVDPNLLPASADFTPAEVQKLRDVLEYQDWRDNRSITAFSKEGKRSKGTVFTVDDYIKLRVEGNELKVWYYNNPNGYHHTVHMHWEATGLVYFAGKNQTIENDFHETISVQSGEFGFPIYQRGVGKTDPWFDKGDSAFIRLGFKSGYTGDNERVYGVHIRHVGNDKVVFNVEVYGESLSINHDIAAGSEWK